MLKKRNRVRTWLAPISVLMALASTAVMAQTPAGTEILAAGKADYSSSIGLPLPQVTSNTVKTVVGDTAYVMVSPGSATQEPQEGVPADFAVSVTNSGNCADTYDLTATAQNGSMVTIYCDDNGDGKRQSTENTVVSNTGTLQVDAQFNCIVSVQLPSDVTSETVIFTARSRFDPTKTGTSTLTVKEKPNMESGPYIQSWLMNGYYVNEDKATRLFTDYLGGEAGISPTEGTVTAGNTWFRYDSDREFVNLNAAYGEQWFCAAYNHVYVYSPTAQRVNMWIGSNDGVRIWLNGNLVWTNDVWRSFVVDKDKFTVDLSEGWNRLMVKISQDKGSWGFSVKICDSDGNQLPGVGYALDPAGTPQEPPADTTPPAISSVIVVASETQATVTWVTDEPATSQVDYGTTSGLGSIAESADLVTQHSVVLSGLSSGTSYHYRITSADAAGNVSQTAISTFQTKAETQEPPPVESGPYIQSWLMNGYYVNEDKATRLFTDYLGGEAGISPTEGTVTAGNTWFRYDSDREFVNLNAAYGEQWFCTAYNHVYVYSPTAQRVNMWIGSNDGVKIWVNGSLVWTNDVWRSFVIDKDKFTVDLSEGWNRLMVKISQDKGSWGFSVRICDSSGAQIPGIAYSLQPGTTLEAPIISEVKITPESTSATVTWRTDMSATSMVDYGTTTSLGMEYSDQALVTQHSVKLENLNPSTTYYLRIGGSNSEGTDSWTGDFSFKTLDPPAVSNGPYVKSWLINGLYDNLDKSTRLFQDYLGGEADVSPIEGSTSGGKTWFSHDSDKEFVDLGKIFNYAKYCTAYAYVNVYSPKAQTANMWLGSNDGARIWVNGSLVFTNDVWRSFVIDKDKFTFPLAMGWNRLLVKISQDGGSWGFSVRICDSAGNALPDVIYSTNR